MKKIILILISLCVGMLIGYHLPKKEEISFYGKILDINNSSIHVQGIPENDINHRGEFIVPSATNFPINSIVKITYTGEVLESYPVQINNVVSIELIE